tara:strand:+ start:259 stop:459 length:201 start_codon:yes stop_codon:yes gene_type:complete
MSKQKQTFASLDPATLAWLEELGITSASELRVLGPSVVYQMIREIHPEAPIHLLGTLRDVARKPRA